MKLLSILILIFSFAVNSFAVTKNGFNLNNSTIPPKEIFQGGPLKDGIPSIDKPIFLKAEDVKFLKKSDRILGINIDGVARGYPIKILNWHEVVNDKIGKFPFVVSYCPLCGTGVGFSSMIDGKKHTFGVSGLLYNSDVLFYDRETNSLWSQLLGKSISGKKVNSKLKILPLTHTTWEDWLKSNPKTLVLSEKTGYYRDYDKNPYDGYEKSRSIYFKVNNTAPDDYHPKEMVLGVEIAGVFKAYPFIELIKNEKKEFNDRVGGKDITVVFNEKSKSGKIFDRNNKEIPSLLSFWFAWFAFHPETLIYTSR